VLDWKSNQTDDDRPFIMKQAHAVDAYSRCAVLMTTNTNANIFCAGSEGLDTTLGLVRSVLFLYCIMHVHDVDF